MISVAVDSMVSRDMPRRRMAALFMASGVKLMAIVKALGTFTRMFCSESAFRRGMLMVMGVKSRNW